MYVCIELRAAPFIEYGAATTKSVGKKEKNDIESGKIRNINKVDVIGFAVSNMVAIKYEHAFLAKSR